MYEIYQDKWIVIAMTVDAYNKIYPLVRFFLGWISTCWLMIVLSYIYIGTCITDSFFFFFLKERLSFINLKKPNRLAKQIPVFNIGGTSLTCIGNWKKQVDASFFFFFLDFQTSWYKLIIIFTPYLLWPLIQKWQYNTKK